MARVLVTLALAAYNNAANRWPPFNRAAYVPANLFAAIVLTLIATSVLGLSLEDLGIATSTPGDAVLGLVLGGALAAPLFALSATTRGARVVADRRVAHLRGAALAYQTLVRVPLGTALWEELAFRGVLVAAWRDEGDVTGALVSSAVFGLWHVAPAATMVRVNAPGARRATVVRGVAATVAATACAGLALVWLRVRTDSLAAPVALHAALNSLATLASVIASRRIEAPPG